jgi:hypothetical protein
MHDPGSFLDFCTRECFFWAKDRFLWIYACTAGGFTLCSNPLLHLGLCNSAAVLHYKTGRADSIEFAGPPDDLQEPSKMPNWWCCHWWWWQHTWPPVSFGSKAPCLHGGLLWNIRTGAGHPYSCEPFTGYYPWWSESFSTPFSSSQRITYNWHGDTIGIRSSSCACCKSWVCWLIQHFYLLSPGGIQFLGCYGLSGEKCSGKWEETPSWSFDIDTVAPQSLECILLLSSNLFLSVSLYPSTLKSVDLRLWHIFLLRRICRVSSAKIHLMIVTLRATQYCYYFPILSWIRMPQFWQRIGMLAL